MNSMLPALLFLSPIFAYGIFLLVQEVSDPVGPFHEKYRLKKVSQFETYAHSTIEDGSRNNFNVLSQLGSLSKFKVILISITSISIITFRPVLQSLFFIIIMIFLYLYFERRRELQFREVHTLLIAKELQAVTEIFAILISSGESVSSALEILSRRTTGEITPILVKGVGHLRHGVSLTSVLDRISQQTALPPLRRFCDSLIIASERGTGLSEVLARQVSEIRSNGHSEKMEAAGRAEIALMIPVVFLILPISVLFALWPSYIALGQSITF